MMKPRVILARTESLGFRDPCACFKDGVCHLYYTLVCQETDGQTFTLAESTSTDLVHFTPPASAASRRRASELFVLGECLFCRRGVSYMLSDLSKVGRGNLRKPGQPTVPDAQPGSWVLERT